MWITPEIRQSHVYVLVEWAKAAPDTTGCAYWPLRFGLGKIDRLANCILV